MTFNAASEFEGIELGDQRRTKRLLQCMAAFANNPQASFPNALETTAASEAFYRLINSEAVQHDVLVDHLVGKTLRRAQAHDGTVLVLHDTSEHSWDGVGTRQGLTQRGAKQKLWSHLSLAVAAEGAPRVLGVAAHQPFVQRDKTWHRILDTKSGEERTLPLDVGSERWLRGAIEVEDAIPADGPKVIHVMDREGDYFDLTAEMAARGYDFVVRSAHDRVLQEGQRLTTALDAHAFTSTREVVLTARNVDGKPPQARKGFPARGAREAKLSIRHGEFDLRAPDATKLRVRSALRLRVVEVKELAPPEGEAPVYWRLLTTLPVESTEDALRVVDIYRRRWLIEEFFKSLKTGCALRERQANSVRTLCDVIALLVPIAADLLNLRAIERHDPNAPADTVLTKVQLTILRKRVPARLPKRGRVTVRHAMLAVAEMGGHFKSNGAPGWQTLGAGWLKLLDLEAGWRAAERHFGVGQA